MSIEITQLTEKIMPNKNTDLLILHDVAGNSLKTISPSNLLSLNNFNLKNYGAVSDGVTDDTNALLAALTAVRLAGNGIIEFPEGTTLISAGDINFNFLDYEGQLIIRGSGSNSVLKVAGATTNKILISNIKSVIIENLTVIGTPTPTAWSMLNYCFRFTQVDLVVIRNNIFAGVRCTATLPNIAGVISCEECNLVLRDNIFGGCGTNLTNNVSNLNWKSIVSENNLFVDYIDVNDVHYELGGDVVNTWINAVNVVNGFNSKVFKVRNNMCDEGATTTFYMYGGGTLDIDGLYCNQGISQAILQQSGATKLKISNAIIKTTGDTGVNREWLGADNVASIELDNVVCGNNSRHIYLSAAVGKIKIRDCNLNVEATYPTGIRNTANAIVDYNQNNIITFGDSNYTATILNDIIICNITLTTDRTVMLPTAVGIKGKEILIKATTLGGNSLIIDGNSSETIDGSTTQSITTNYGWCKIQSDGANWFIVNSKLL